MFLLVPPEDKAEFLALITSVPDYPSTIPQFWFSAIEYPKGPVKFFLDIEIPAPRPGLSARDIHALLSPHFHDTDIVYLSKIPGAGESTHWHIVINVVDRWGRHKRRARRLLAALRESEDERATTLASGIDEVVWTRPPSLRSPRSVKLFNGLDERFYRCVASSYSERFFIHNRGDQDSHGFLMGPGLAAPEVADLVAWTTNTPKVLSVPNFAAVMPFRYSLSYPKPTELLAIVKDFFETRALDPADKMSLGTWDDLTEDVVKYLNQFFAHARDGGVYVVTAPHNYSPTWDPTGTVILARNTYKRYSPDALTRNFKDYSSLLIPPHKTKINRVFWVEEWFAHTDKHNYETAYGYSKRLRVPDHVDQAVPPVFNTWTGPGVWPEEAFNAVKKNPQQAVEVVDFFVEYLQTIICGDPFEHANYNAWMFQAVIHFLVWLVKRPHDPFPAVLYFWSPEQGVGKGQLTALMTQLVGMHNTHSGTGSSGLSSNFLGYIADKLLWIMDEESSRAKDAEASGTIKRVATEALISGEKKYQDPRLINNSVKLLATSNQLRPIQLGERRWASTAVNSERRGDTSYWNEFVDKMFTNCGYLYVAAWLLGIDPHPDFKPGMQVPKGYLRVRQAEKDSATDPLQAVLMPWFATATSLRQKEVKYVEEEGYVVPFEVEHQVFSIDGNSARFEVSSKRFLDDWFSGNSPSAPHYNQPMLVGLCLDKSLLIGECAATKLTKSYTVHNLKRSIGEVFGDKHAPLFTFNEGRRYYFCTFTAEDHFMKLVCKRFAKLIDDARTFRIGDEEVEGVWPIPYSRLVTFAYNGVHQEIVDGVTKYHVNHVMLDFGDASPALLVWPPPEETRERCFQNSGGGRTPVEEIQRYDTNYDWYRQGFASVRGHPTEEAAQEYVRERSEADHAPRARQNQIAQEEFEAMMRGEFE
jgi:hypothetical protein